MELDRVLARRRMVRNFEDRPLVADMVDRLVGAALRAPSAGFAQGVDLLVLEGSEQTGRFWAACPAPPGSEARSCRPGVLQAPLLIVVLSSERVYRDRYAEPDKAWSGLAEGPWPVPYWHVDAAFAALLVLLTAVDEGLGALFFGVSDTAGLRAAFGIPGEYTPVGVVAVGHALAERPSASLTRGRRPAQQVVHRGRW
ncbi:MAG: nitroreductase family protein [Acidimicrobiales bacterium]